MITRVSTRCNDPANIYCNHEKYMTLITVPLVSTSDRFLKKSSPDFFWGSGRNTPKWNIKTCKNFAPPWNQHFFPLKSWPGPPISESSSIPTIENPRGGKLGLFQVRVRGWQTKNPSSHGGSWVVTRWWFQIFFIFPPTWGKISNLTNICQIGWNHQLGYDSPQIPEKT